eukprot:GDKJ01064647.1.p2 GENE.GDKJ01064647.1~~GDKJ01064647.1.p2  ORF type:complete len:138 (-),score=10.52 GDKJ01064647.1:486-899(-)
MSVSIFICFVNSNSMTTSVLHSIKNTSTSTTDVTSFQSGGEANTGQAEEEADCKSADNRNAGPSPTVMNSRSHNNVFSFLLLALENDVKVPSGEMKKIKSFREPTYVLPIRQCISVVNSPTRKPCSVCTTMSAFDNF